MLTSEHSTFLGQQIGNYEVKELLIERAVSNLYLAHDVAADRPVFLEIFHPFIDHTSNLAAQFQQRTKSVAQLEHVNIAAVHDVGVTAANVIYAAIEFVPGVSLAQKLAGAEAFTAVEALGFVRQISSALVVANSAGLIHHDLRPKNIIVSGDRPVLIDLTVPVVANVSTPPASSEQPDVLDYAPPEHLSSKKLTAQGNIYSLGIILYELLAGHRPRLISSPWDIFENTARAIPIALEEARDGLHPETYRLVKECLHRQEWARYESMEQMLVAIDIAIAAEQSGAPGTAAAVPHRSRRVWGAAAGGVILLVLLLLLWARGNRSNAQISAGQLGTSVPAGGTADPASALANSRATTTLSPTPKTTPTSLPETPVEPLTPANSSEFSRGEDITFGWAYASPLETEQQFVIYLLSGGREAAHLGSVTEPVVGIQYRLVVDGGELDVAAGVYDWQIVLEDAATGARLAAGSPRSIRLLDPTPTSSPSPTATATLSPVPSATPTATPTPCIVSPWPTWMRYTVQPGDTLSSLAEERGTLIEEIMRVNCLENNLLSVGRVLWLPPLPATDTPMPTSTAVPPPAPPEGSPPQPPSETRPPAPTEEPPPTPTPPPP